jgi:hypothetical protein
MPSDILTDLRELEELIKERDMDCALDMITEQHTLSAAIEEITKLREPPIYMKGNDMLRLQGSIQGLQESLERSMKREERLQQLFDKLQTDFIHMKDMRDKILEERPLTLKPGWRIDKVTCSCAAEIHPVALLDVDEWDLLWPEECPECFRKVEMENTITWPFKSETAYAKDFERLGFDIE